MLRVRVRHSRFYRLKHVRRDAVIISLHWRQERLWLRLHQRHARYLYRRTQRILVEIGFGVHW